MDVAALVVAIFATAVALGSLGWQYYAWWHERRLTIKVDLDQVDNVRDTDLHNTFLTVFRVTVTNRSAFPVRVERVALVPVGGQVRSWWAESGGLPQNVRARDAEHIDLSLEAIGELPDAPLEACIQLSTGEEFRSVPTSLPAQST